MYDADSEKLCNLMTSISMSDLHVRLTGDLKDAMRSGDAIRRDCLRGLITAVKNEAIAQKILDVTTLSDETVITVLKRARKQREDAAVQYRDGGREDLAMKEEQESVVIGSYLPAQMDDMAIAAVVDDVLAQVTGAANMGTVMGQVMARLKGQADGVTVRRIVESKIQ